MRQFLDLLQDIIDNGIDCPDRTGVGRRKVFGRQMRFNMKDGFPLPTTNGTFVRGMIKETLWFIKGASNANELSDLGVHIWDGWKVSKEDVIKYYREHTSMLEDIPEDQHEAILQPAFDMHVGQIGPIYGPNWRNIFNHPDESIVDFAMFHPVTADKIASDKIEQYEKMYEDASKQHIEQYPDQPFFTKEQFFSLIRAQNTDQLQEVINTLKTKPFSSRIIISAWNAPLIPSEEYSPQMNVMMGKGALAPCHVFQQYLVLPPAQEGGKLRLSLLMYQR